jgi:hypothetical protein
LEDFGLRYGLAVFLGRRRWIAVGGDPALVEEMDVR